LRHGPTQVWQSRRVRGYSENRASQPACELQTTCTDSCSDGLEPVDPLSSTDGVALRARTPSGSACRVEHLWSARVDLPSNTEGRAGPPRRNAFLRPLERLWSSDSLLASEFWRRRGRN